MAVLDRFLSMFQKRSYLVEVGGVSHRHAQNQKVCDISPTLCGTHSKLSRAADSVAAASFGEGRRTRVSKGHDT